MKKSSSVKKEAREQPSRGQQTIAEKHIEAKRRAKKIFRGPGSVHLHHNGEDDDGSGSIERASYTIKEFCRAHRISEALFFKLKKLGQGPRELHAGGRVTISVEAAAEWRREREAAAGARLHAAAKPI